jgi:hypothetical protein
VFGSVLVGLLPSCCMGSRRASFLSLIVKPLLTRVGAVLLSLRIRGCHRAGHEAHPGWSTHPGCAVEPYLSLGLSGSNGVHNLVIGSMRPTPSVIPE